jgi:hypothetical protein
MTYTIYTKAEGKVVGAAMGYGRTIDTLDALAPLLPLSALNVKDRHGRIWDAADFHDAKSTAEPLEPTEE